MAWCQPFSVNPVILPQFLKQGGALYRGQVAVIDLGVE
jgi:hypothetical protein